ncbi:MAG: hypothetical protein ACXW3L_07195 [Limisphaerales bacterium]
MITNNKTSPFLLLATGALICAFTSLCALAADKSATPSALQPRPSQKLRVAKASAADTSARNDFLQPKGSFHTLAATSTPRLTVARRQNENLARHVSTFRGPIGPTLPAGATLHLNPAAVSTLLVVNAAPDDLIFDLPPGAFLRKTAIAQTQ